MENPEHELRQIHDRNRRVETEKAWEVSLTRRLFIALVTYLTSAIFLWLIGDVLPFLKALVPAAGYLFSTLSLPWIKGFWMRKRD